MADGVGVPDHLQRLWTPHRLAYITGGVANRPEGAGDAVDIAAGDADDAADAGDSVGAGDSADAGDSVEGAAAGSPAVDCVFCRAPSLPDAETLVVARGGTVYAVLNLFPYNPGHLMVVPYRHLADYTELDEEELAEFSAFTRHALSVIRSVSAPHGFNIGINAGSAAGAGIAAHLHQHVVPRWGGDANFMPVVGQTKVLPQLLGTTRDLIAEAW